MQATSLWEQEPELLRGLWCSSQWLKICWSLETQQRSLASLSMLAKTNTMLSELSSEALIRTYGERLQRVLDILDLHLLKCPISVYMHAADGTVTTVCKNGEYLKIWGEECSTFAHWCLINPMDPRYII